MTPKLNLATPPAMAGNLRQWLLDWSEACSVSEQEAAEWLLGGSVALEAYLPTQRDRLGLERLAESGDLARRPTCSSCGGSGDTGDWRQLNCLSCGGSGRVGLSGRERRPLAVVGDVDDALVTDLVQPADELEAEHDVDDYINDEPPTFPWEGGSR